jgi:hypothetical protein
MFMQMTLDTRYYWDLSPSIFRYNHQNFGEQVTGLPKGIHTVNECQSAIRFIILIDLRSLRHRSRLFHGNDRILYYAHSQY